MTQRIVFLVAAGLLGLAAFFVVRESRLRGVADERLRIAKEQETIAVRAYKVAHDSIPMLLAGYAKERAEKLSLRDKVSNLSQTVDSVTRNSRVVLADTGATVSVLRFALSRQVDITDSLSTAFQAYVTADIQADSATEAVIGGLRLALVRADTALAAAQRVSATYKSRECRVWFLPCPTRLQSAIAGAVVGGYLVIKATK